MKSLLILVGVLASESFSSFAFTPSRIYAPSLPGMTPFSRGSFPLPRHQQSTTAMRMQPFDISKPVLDLYSLRSIRGDALTKYNALNQSEPLRINLAALACLIFLSLPTLSREVSDIPLTIPQVAASLAASGTSAALFVRECRRRSRQLNRLEKELIARDLRLRPPTNPLADRAYSDALSIRRIQEYGGGPRILALYCEEQDGMDRVLEDIAVIGRRLKQANVLVVPIVAKPGPTSGRRDWLASPDAPQEWLDYFASLSSANDLASLTDASSFKWFGLSSTGRSFGSGAGEEPSWLQLMGQHLRPLDIMEPDGRDRKEAKDANVEETIMRLQANFYDSLTTGKVESLKSMFVDNVTKEVTDVANLGGRLDSWNFCLEDGARPEGMKTGDSDVTVNSETRAFSTTVEFPVADGLTDARLLAIQEWGRPDAKSEWKLVQHRTIPWTTDVAAAGTLICDCRGCVSLVSGPQRRTFGGVIG
jgi:hypothetical protein